MMKDNPKFPENFLEYLREIMDKTDILLINSDTMVIEELCSRNIPNFIVYPNSADKKEYLEHYKKDNQEPDIVIKLMDRDWDGIINSIISCDGSTPIALAKGQKLLDILSTDPAAYHTTQQEG